MEQCNGWTNEPTWLLYGWMTAEEAVYKAWRERAAEALKEAAGDEDKAAYYLGKAIKETLEDENPAERAGFFADAAAWVLRLIDYEEVARAFLEEAAQ